MAEELSKGFPCTIYPGKNGRSHEILITNIYESDAKYFQTVGAGVSMEPIGSQYAVYADIGLFEEDEETPRELIALSGSRSCQDTIRELRLECEKVLKESS